MSSGNGENNWNKHIELSSFCNSKLMKEDAQGLVNRVIRFC